MNLDITTIREDIQYELRRLEQADRARIEGCVTDESALQAAQRRRRERIAVLEAEAQCLVALEESAAELREQFDPAFQSHPMDRMASQEERREALRPRYANAVKAFYAGRES